MEYKTTVVDLSDSSSQENISLPKSFFPSPEPRKEECSKHSLLAQPSDKKDEDKLQHKADNNTKENQTNSKTIQEPTAWMIEVKVLTDRLYNKMLNAINFLENFSNLDDMQSSEKLEISYEENLSQNLSSINNNVDMKSGNASSNKTLNKNQNLQMEMKERLIEMKSVTRRIKYLIPFSTKERLQLLQTYSKSPVRNLLSPRAQTFSSGALMKLVQINNEINKFMNQNLKTNLNNMNEDSQNDPSKKSIPIHFTNSNSERITGTLHKHERDSKNFTVKNTKNVISKCRSPIKTYPKSLNERIEKVVKLDLHQRTTIKTPPIKYENFDFQDYISKIKKVHKRQTLTEKEQHHTDSFDFNDYYKKVVNLRDKHENMKQVATSPGTSVTLATSLQAQSPNKVLGEHAQVVQSEVLNTFITDLEDYFVQKKDDKLTGKLRRGGLTPLSTPHRDPQTSNHTPVLTIQNKDSTNNAKIEKLNRSVAINESVHKIKKEKPTPIRETFRKFVQKFSPARFIS